VVTGISTGALTARFAFLGSEHDEESKTLYTTITTHDIVKQRNVISAAFSDSMTDATPLKALIAKHIGPDKIEAIARGHDQGRRLFVGTVNLDSGRSVIWNIGAIAGSGYADKVNLVREILRASAAIPVALFEMPISTPTTWASSAASCQSPPVRSKR
jgi:predicted acylesterase/phospholipase RssA